MDEQEARIDAILEGTGDSLSEAVDTFFSYLSEHLQLPCEVTGVDDFRWEERFVIGPGDSAEYERLKEIRPSHTDLFELLAIERGAASEWMIWAGEDIGAYVRRKSDGKEFTLGLAELTVVDKASPNHTLVEDYGDFFVNSM